MNIMVTGGTGLIGRSLIQQVLTQGHQVTVITRNAAQARTHFDNRITLLQGLSERRDLNGIDAVINLAGEPIANKRWSKTQKQCLCDSRWRITQRLVDLIQSSDTPPAVLISGSAVGYYGNLGETVITEETSPHDEFTHRLCARWEDIASRASSAQTRVCLLRTGVVLSPDGGILDKFTPLFLMGLGGPQGNGQQYLSWIHIEDMVNGILWMLEHDERGPFNMVSPCPVRNEQFTRALGHTLHRPAILRAPALAMRLIMGESAALVLGSQYALPKRLEETGFHFRWRNLNETLKNLLG